jgi:hypothetical protein
MSANEVSSVRDTDNGTLATQPGAPWIFLGFDDHGRDRRKSAQMKSLRALGWELLSKTSVSIFSSANSRQKEQGGMGSAVLIKCFLNP